MDKRLLIVLCIFLASCKAVTTYYVVRHAEKEQATSMTSDVPLTPAGKQRADALKDVLAGKGVTAIYSTNYVRTKSTAQPLADALKLPVQTYDVRDTLFPVRLRSAVGTMVIVGHSNTVDDIVNKITGRRDIPGDLSDADYGDLFIIKRKGDHFTFDKKRFGQ